VNSPEDGPVGPKHVEIRQYINKIEIVTSVGFYSIYIYIFVPSRTYHCIIVSVLKIYHKICGTSRK